MEVGRRDRGAYEGDARGGHRSNGRGGGRGGGQRSRPDSPFSGDRDGGGGESRSSGRRGGLSGRGGRGGRGGRNGRERKIRHYDMPALGVEKHDGMTRKSRLFLASKAMVAGAIPGAVGAAPRAAEDTGLPEGELPQQPQTAKRVQQGKKPDESFNAFKARMKAETQAILIANAKANSKTHQKRKQYMRDRKQRAKNKKQRKKTELEEDSR